MMSCHLPQQQQHVSGVDESMPIGLEENNNAPIGTVTESLVDKGKNNNNNEVLFIHHRFCDECYACPILGKRFCSETLPGKDFCELCKDHYQEDNQNVVFHEAVDDNDAENQGDLKRLLESQLKFRLWKEPREATGFGKTTLPQQIDLASELWMESMKSSASYSNQQIIEALEMTLIQDSNSLVSWKGLRVGWFLGVFCKMPYMQKLIDFGCELWFFRRVCVVEIICQAHSMLQAESSTCTSPLVLSGSFVNFMDVILLGLGLEGDATEIVDTPTTFISYTGGYTLKQTFEVLQQLDPNEYIWMDIFCVNQFAWTGKSRSPEMHHFKESFLGDLQGQIKSIGKTALILEKWDNIMMTLEQIWVLWEVFSTADAGADLHVLLPPDQTRDFVSCCLESLEKFESILVSLAKVDANNAKAEEDDDRKRILLRIQESGVSKVNNIATDAMREWVQKQGMAQLDHLDKAKEKVGEHAATGPSWVLSSNLGRLFYEQGKYEEAERLFRQSLVKCQNSLGPDDPDTLTQVNNMGVLLFDRGKLPEAEVFYRRAFETRQKLLGSEHPNTLMSINNLAVLLHAKGDLDEAVLLFQGVLEKRKDVLGPEHTDTLTTTNNLAVLMKEQGKLAEAEQLHRKALGIRQNHQGHDHPDTLTSMNNLALLLQDQGKLMEAEDMYCQAMEKYRKVRGPDHPDTLVPLNNLAWLLRDQGKFDESEQLHRHALDVQQKVLGPNHSSTLLSVSNLAFALKAHGKLEESGHLYQQALEGRQELYGPDHPDTLMSVFDLAVLRYDQERYVEAEQLHRQTLEKRLTVLGPEHNDTLHSMSNLAFTLHRIGKWDDAKPMLQNVLETRKRVQGENHAATVQSTANLAYCCFHNGETVLAQTLLKECLQKARSVMGPENPNTMRWQTYCDDWFAKENDGNDPVTLLVPTTKKA